jgi:hypothetical protein
MLFALVAVLLILWLLGVIGNFTFGGAVHLLLIVVIVALVLGLAEPRGRATRFRFSTNPGTALAGVWFLLTGLLSLFNFTFPGQPLVMAVLALIAGVLLIMGR